jgi:hypothetical protein
MSWWRRTYSTYCGPGRTASRRPCSHRSARCSCPDTYGRCPSGRQASAPADHDRQTGSFYSGHSRRGEPVFN